MKLFEKTISSKEIFHGKIITVQHDDAELENGAKVKREVVRHPGGVCVAAVNERDELAFVRQFRYPYSEVVTELPAGKLEPGEDPFDAIKRELSEEVGAVGEQWKDMGKLYPSPGYCSEIIHLYSCNITSVGSTHPDEDEFLEIEYIPLEKAVDMVISGQLRDAKTQTLVLKLWAERTRNK